MLRSISSFGVSYEVPMPVSGNANQAAGMPLGAGDVASTQTVKSPATKRKSGPFAGDVVA